MPVFLLQIKKRRTPDFLLLGVCYRQTGQPKIQVAACFNFYKTKFAAFSGNNIDLAITAAVIPAADNVTLTFQISAGSIFALLPQRLPGLCHFPASSENNLLPARMTGVKCILFTGS